MRWLKAVGDRYPAGGAVTVGRYGRCVITVHAPAVPAVGGEQERALLEVDAVVQEGRHQLSLQNVLHAALELRTGTGISLT